MFTRFISTPSTVRQAAVKSRGGDFSTSRERNMRSGKTTPSRTSSMNMTLAVFSTVR